VQLTGAPFLAAVLAVTVVGFVAGAAWLPRTRRSPRGFIARLLTQVAVSALNLLLVAVVLNNTNGWYANWGDLLGSGSPSVQQDQGGTDAAKALQARPSGPGLPAAAAGALPPLPAPGQRVQTLGQIDAVSRPRPSMTWHAAVLATCVIPPRSTRSLQGAPCAPSVVRSERRPTARADLANALICRRCDVRSCALPRLSDSVLELTLVLVRALAYRVAGCDQRTRVAGCGFGAAARCGC